jgi:hypothetical protein
VPFRESPRGFARATLIRISFCMGPGPRAGEPVAGPRALFGPWRAPSGWRGALRASGNRLSGFRTGRKRSLSSQTVSSQIRATRSVAGRLAQEFSLPVNFLAVLLRRSRPRVGFRLQHPPAHPPPDIVAGASLRSASARDRRQTRSQPSCIDSRTQGRNQQARRSPRRAPSAAPLRLWRRW